MEMNLGNKTNRSQKVERDSNMELLRIVSMLLVLIVHSCFKSVGAPLMNEIIESPFTSFLRFFCESFSIICVNVFILISGWYGVHLKPGRLFSFVFQVLFIGVVIYFVFRIFGLVNAWNVSDWFELLFFRRDLWFVNAYIVFYIFTPVLNAFVEHTDRERLKQFLILFFVVQTFFGFLFSEPYFSKGYSPLSFMGLYLLARYARLYPNRYTTLNKKYDLAVYVAVTFVLALLSSCFVRLSGKGGHVLFSYTSPLVVLSAFYFFLFFTKIPFRSHVVNGVASSAFAIYLVHCDPLIFKPYYCELIHRWYSECVTASFLLYTSLYILFILAVSILIDKIRIAVWIGLTRLIPEKRK
jgi:surface polysaccharide O-acyltransferase-like enzyme